MATYRTSFDKENKQWSGPRTQPIFNLQTSLGNVLLNLLEINGLKYAQVRKYNIGFNDSHTNIQISSFLPRSVRIQTKAQHTMNSVHYQFASQVIVESWDFEKEM